MSDILAGPYFLAGFLLALAGLGKIRHPAPASRALAAAGLPDRWVAVRTLGIIEVTVGGLALAAPTAPVSLALAFTYLSFAAFLTYLIMARVPAASCGCAGSRDTPPSVLHVVLDLFAVAAAVAVALDPVSDVVRFALGTPFKGIPLLGLLAVLGYVAVMSTSGLPEIRALVARSFRVGHRHGGMSGDAPRPAVFQIRGLERSWSD
jgi:hypothetical protein